MRGRLLLLLISISFVSSCPSDFIYDPKYQKCYKASAAKMNRFQAQRFCQEKDSVLFEIMSATDNNQLQAIAGSNGLVGVWIGATCTGKVGSSCLNEEGVPTNYTNFQNGENPNDKGACVKMGLSGSWYSSSCVKDQTQVVCLYKGTTPSQTCSPGSWLFNGNCYRPLVADLAVKSEEMCNNHGGNLASIHSEGENNFVSDVVFNSFGDKQEFFRIGLAEFDGRNWTWTDETPLDYENFGLEIPNRDCVDVSLSQGMWGQWITAPCNSVVASVCKTSATASSPGKTSSLCVHGSTLQTNTTIFSPGYPNYFHLEDCQNAIVQQGMIIYIQFLELYLDEASSISLYDDLVSTNPFAIITYSSSPFSQFRSSGTLKIKFHGNNTKKENARWRAVTTSFPYQVTPGSVSKCGSTLVNSGFFSSQNYASGQTASRCVIVLQSKSTSNTVVVNFFDFFVGPNDQVTFYDGPSATSKAIATYSGPQPNLVLESTGPYMTIIVSGLTKGYRGIYGQFYSN